MKRTYIKIIDEAKKLAAAFQGVVLGEMGSDCGTDLAVTIEVTKANSGLLGNRYIVMGQSLTLMEDGKMGNYIGKTVKLRSPMYCKDDNICSKCAGELFYKLGMRNAGLVSNVIGTSITNLAMKSQGLVSIQ